MTASVGAAPAHIEWDKVKCSNCMSCVVVCAERHTGISAPARAHIHILVDLLVGGEISARYCRQCAEADCAAACPEGAITYSETVRAWLVDAEACLACEACVTACPYAAIALDPETNIARKCDLCEGAVRCVEICPTGALILVGVPEEA